MTRQSRIPHLLAYLTAACTGCVMEAAPDEHAGRIVHAIPGGANAAFADMQPPFHRVDEAVGDTISNVAIAHDTSSRAVTASRTSTGNLELVSWDISTTGTIIARDTETAGPASEIAIAQASDMVTAFRNSAGDLEIISWEVAANGVISKLHEAAAGAVSKVAVTRQPSGSGVVTAFRNASGDLGLIAWDVALVGGAITRKGDNGAGAVSHVAITTTQISCNCVVTAVRNSAGNLQLTSWQVTGAQNIVRIDDDEGGAISDVALTSVQMSNTSQFIVAGVRDSNAKLQLIVWEVTSTGHLVRHGEAIGGAISDVAISTDGVAQVISAVRDGSGELKLIGWEVTSTGNLVREGEDAAGAVSNVALTSSFKSGGKRFAMPAMRDGDGRLRVITWQTNLTP